MNSWAKHVLLTVAAIPFLACAVYHQSGNQVQKDHQIDSLPKTIIQPPIKQKDSILSIDTSTWILDKNQVFFSKNFCLKAKENSTFDILSTGLFNIDQLPNMKFRNIKIAVVDFGNINYLKQVFKLCHTKKR